MRLFAGKNNADERAELQTLGAQANIIERDARKGMPNVAKSRAENLKRHGYNRADVEAGVNYVEKHPTPGVSAESAAKKATATRGILGRFFGE